MSDFDNLIKCLDIQRDLHEVNHLIDTISPNYYFNLQDYKKLTKDVLFPIEIDKLCFINEKYKHKFMNNFNRICKYDLNNNKSTSKYFRFYTGGPKPTLINPNFVDKLRDNFLNDKKLGKTRIVKKRRQVKDMEEPVRKEGVEEEAKPETVNDLKRNSKTLGKVRTETKLRKAISRTHKVKRTREKGDEEAANKMEDDDRWRDSILMASGEKPMPSVDLLKKKLKIKQKRKQKSLKMWTERKRVEESNKSIRQSKRTKNIQSRGHGRC